nr:hypothetical protein [Tanacetum cinerariifolium]
LIEECSIKVPEEQKQKMKNTMFELVKIYQEKEFLCIHDDINDLIKSALNSKLLLINSNSQHLDKQEQEVKNVVEQPAEHGNHKPEHSLSMGYEHLSIIPETESDEVTESNVENLLPIPNPHCFNVESDFVEYLLNRDTFIDFSSKFDFSSELAHIKPEIPKSDFDFENEIRLIENLLYDNSIPRLPPKPPDVETDAGEEIPVVMNDKDEDVD